MISRMSSFFMNIIRNNSEGMTAEREEVIQYGLEVFINDLLQTIILFILASVLGIFKHVLFFFISYGILRSFTGGSHARTRLQCTLTYLITAACVILLSFNLQIDNYLVYLLVYVLELYLIYKFAPGDTEEKPIPSSRQRKQLRRFSLLALSVNLLIAVVLLIYDPVLSNIILFSTVSVILLLSPLGYRLSGCRYGRQSDIYGS